MSVRELTALNGSNIDGKVDATALVTIDARRQKSVGLHDHSPLKLHLRAKGS